MSTKSAKIANATTTIAKANKAKGTEAKAAKAASAKAKAEAAAKAEADREAAAKAAHEANAAQRVAYFAEVREQREAAKAAEGRADAAAFVGTVKLGAVTPGELGQAGYSEKSAKANASVWNLGAKVAEAIGADRALALIAQLEAAPQVGAVRTRDRIAKGLRAVRDAAKEAGGKLDPNAADAAMAEAVADAGTLKPRDAQTEPKAKAKGKGEPVAITVETPGDVCRVLAALYATAAKMQGPSKDANDAHAWATVLDLMGKATEAGAPLR